MQHHGMRLAVFVLTAAVIIGFGAWLTARYSQKWSKSSEPPVLQGAPPQSPSVSTTRHGKEGWIEKQSTRETTPIGLPQTDPQVVTVLYATNRVVNASTNELIPAQVTALRSPNLSFGSVAVRIPEKHDIGEVEQPKEITFIGVTLWREELSEKEHFVLGEIHPFTKEEFIATVGADKDRSALVFVHGFNTDFVGAIFKLAQIVFDAKYAGLPIAFIWPSRGGVINYDHDHELALASRESFRELLNILYKDAELKKIHIIAHSMGNQVTIETLNQLSLMKEDVKLSELVLAAPDVDKDGFLIVAQRLRALVDGITIYVSSADKALQLSKLKAGAPRLGDSSEGGPAVFPGIDTIDVTALGEDVFELNHGVFSDNRSAIDDVGRLLQGVRPPGTRTPQLRGMPVGKNPPTYWRYPD